MWKPSFTMTELQFFATIKTKVSIIPDFTDAAIYLMSTRVGPFKASLQTTVPLWLALQLKANQKCQIISPFWFEEPTLNGFLEQEKKNPNELTNLQNQQFFQISYIFISKAPDNIEKIIQVRNLVEGLQNIRREKVRRLFQQGKGAIKLLNLTTYQANRLREPLCKLSMMVDRLKKGEKQK